MSSAKRSSAKRTSKPSKPAPKQASAGKASAKKAGAVRKASASAPILLITGDQRCALEYGAIAAAKGYAIHLWDVQPPASKTQLSAGMKVVPVPTPAASVALELTIINTDAKRLRLQKIDAILPQTAPLLSTSLTVSVVEQASWITGKHRLVGFAGLPTFAERNLVETAPTVFSPRQTLDAVAAFWTSLGRTMEIVQDRVGLVSARIICQLINEAAFTLGEDVARPDDIDTAMKLGVSYPHGPFDWADRIGVLNVEAILRALQREYQEERYRVAPLLRTMALGGEWWKRGLGDAPSAQENP